VAGEKSCLAFCIVDAKRHIRKFLEEALGELGFTTCELSAVLDGQAPDLVIAGLPPMTP
jgi:hypothetical protein